MSANKKSYTISSTVFKWQGQAGWHFISIPKEQSEEIKKNFGSTSKGWGSLPVTVTVGKTTWKTSIFPDKKLGCYLLPLKAIIRKKEGIFEGSMIKFSILFA